MKSIAYGDSIKRILISEKINCDAIVVSDEMLQYTLLYHSEAKKTFTDNLIKSAISFATRESIICTIPKIMKSNNQNDINNLRKLLTGINISIASLDVLLGVNQYLHEKEKYKELTSSKYIQFYSTKANSFILLNRKLLDTNFNDTLQVCIDCYPLCGLYTNPDSDHELCIYQNFHDGNYYLENTTPSKYLHHN